MTIWIFITIIGVVIVGFLVSRDRRDKVVGICRTAIGLDARKRENKEKILALLAERSEVSNSDIREVLGVSDRTVVRYMNELEEEGNVEQVGEIGHQVTYRLK